MKKNLNYFAFALSFLTMLFFFTCKEEGQEPILKLNESELQVEGAGDTILIKVTSNISWRAVSSEDWCEVDEDRDALVVKVAPNSKSTERVATVIVSGNSLRCEVIVTQRGVESTEKTDDEAVEEDVDDSKESGDENSGTSSDTNDSNNDTKDEGNTEGENNEKDENEEPETPHYFFIILTASPWEGGTVSGWGLAEIGGKNVVTATANDEYEFVGWSDGVTSAKREVTYNGESSLSLTAYFEKYDPSKMSGYKGEYAYVDLGLSVMWATYNVGGSKPTDFGDLFAWGETSPKEYYKQENYKWGVSMYHYTKYCTKSYNGTVDGKTVLDKGDDAACANWGGSWRMPTADEMAELVRGCDWEWVAHYNGTTHNGQLGKSKKNGNVIFLPASGEGRGMGIMAQNGYGYYWTKSLYKENPDRTYNIHFGTGDEIDPYDVQDRVHGMAVRPVFNR